LEQHALVRRPACLPAGCPLGCSASQCARVHNCRQPLAPLLYPPRSPGRPLALTRSLACGRRRRPSSAGWRSERPAPVWCVQTPADSTWRAARKQCHSGRSVVPPPPPPPSSELAGRSHRAGAEPLLARASSKAGASRQNPPNASKSNNEGATLNTLHKPIYSLYIIFMIILYHIFFFSLSCKGRGALLFRAASRPASQPTFWELEGARAGCLCKGWSLSLGLGSLSSARRRWAHTRGACGRPRARLRVALLVRPPHLGGQSSFVAALSLSRLRSRSRRPFPRRRLEIVIEIEAAIIILIIIIISQRQGRQRKSHQ